MSVEDSSDEGVCEEVRATMRFGDTETNRLVSYMGKVKIISTVWLLSDDDASRKQLWQFDLSVFFIVE